MRHSFDMSKAFSLGVQGWYLPQPHTGIGQHSIGLLRALAKEKVTCEVLVPKPVKIKGIPQKWIKVLPTKAWIPHPALKKWFWERVQVPQVFAKRELDWELYPYPCPLDSHSNHLRAMTVHDLIPWTDERYQVKGLKKRYYDLALSSLAKVDQVFAVSHCTLNELGLETAEVLPNAIPELPQKWSRLPQRKALVYVGGYDLRKQVPKLIEAFTALRKKEPDMELLLIGKAHHQSKYYPPLPKAEGVIELGALSDAKLYAVMKSAFAFVHYSDSEGFNIPLLQAMSIGIPAIVRDLPVNLEVSDGTALYLKGSRKNELFDSIQILKDPKKYKAIVQAQKKAARAYSWGKSAKKLIKTLQNGT